MYFRTVTPHCPLPDHVRTFWGSWRSNPQECGGPPKIATPPEVSYYRGIPYPASSSLSEWSFTCSYLFRLQWFLFQENWCWLSLPCNLISRSLWFSVYSSFLIIWVGWQFPSSLPIGVGTGHPCPAQGAVGLFSPALSQQTSRCPKGSDSIGKVLGGPWYYGRSQWRFAQSTLSIHILKRLSKNSAKKEVLILSPVPVTVSNQEVKAPGREKW